MSDVTIPLSKWPTTAARLIFQSLRHPLTSKVIEVGDDGVVVKSDPKTRTKHEDPSSTPAHSHG